jgi:hypothetical protein
LMTSRLVDISFSFPVVENLGPGRFAAFDVDQRWEIARSLLRVVRIRLRAGEAALVHQPH